MKTYCITDFGALSNGEIMTDKIQAAIDTCFLDGGGTVVASGTPEEVAENPRSYTGMFLKKML